MHCVLKPWCSRSQVRPLTSLTPVSADRYLCFSLLSSSSSSAAAAAAVGAAAAAVWCATLPAVNCTSITTVNNTTCQRPHADRQTDRQTDTQLEWRRQIATIIARCRCRQANIRSDRRDHAKLTLSTSALQVIHIRFVVISQNDTRSLNVGYSAVFGTRRKFINWKFWPTFRLKLYVFWVRTTCFIRKMKSACFLLLLLGAIFDFCVAV